MDRLLFIINPVAGGGKTKEIIPLIESKMKSNHIDYKIVQTSKPKEAIKLVEEMVESFPIIIAVGGDGTVNEVAKGMILKKKGILGIIPCGTGNDFGRALGLSQDANQAIDTIIKKNTRKIDIGKINGYSFLNIASIGFDTEVVIKTNYIKKKIKNKTAYIIGVLATLFRFKRSETSFIIDDREYTRDLVLLAVGNGGFYGGGLKILPMAKIDDGYFHICLVRDIGNFKLLFLFPSIFKGQHLKYKKYVEIFRANKVVIKNKKLINLNIDGEIVPINKDIVFEIDEHKLQVIF